MFLKCHINKMRTNDEKENEKMNKFLCLFLSAVYVVVSVPNFTIQSETMYFGSGYNGSVYEGSSTEYISYSTKSENEYAIKGGLPRYYDRGTNDNTCANVAGAIALGYYDKTYDELIPNFKAARVIKDKVIYSAPTEAVQAVIDKLYVSMETNGTSAGGTTISGFKNGLKSYVNDQGRSITYSSVGQNNKINRQAYIDSIEAERPVVLFMSGYSLLPVADFSDTSTRDKLEIKHYTGNHMLVACGLKEVKYYNSNGSLNQTLTLFIVSTGYSLDSICYLDVRGGSLIDSYSINIY